MADTLSITLEIQEGGTTAKLTNFVRNAEEASNKVNRAGRNIDFSKGFVTDLDRAEARLNKFNANFRGVMDSFVGNIGANAVGKFTSVVTEGGKAILDYSANLEQAKIGMTTMTGSVVTAGIHLKELQNFAKTTPFEFAELVTASQKFQGVGINAQKIIPILTNVGNSLAAAGRISELPFATKAISDIVAKGRLQGQEIIQLANAGIPALKILSGALGKTQAEIIALGEDGKISSDIFLKALSDYSKQNFGDAMLAQSRTFSGAMSNVKDTLYITSQTAFDPLYQKISGVSVELADKLSNEKDFGKVGTVIAKSVAKGFGDSLREELAREIAGIKAGKENPLDLFNANLQIGGALQQGVFGERGNPVDILKSSFALVRKKTFSTADIKDIEAINFFGQFNDELARLYLEAKEKKDKLNELLRQTPSAVLGSGIGNLVTAIGGIGQSVNNLPNVSDKLGLGKATEEAQKLADQINKFNLSSVDSYLEYGKAKINSGDGNDLQKIREISELEQLAIKEKIRLQKQFNNEQLRNFTPEERNGAKGTQFALQSVEAVNRLESQGRIAQLNAQRQINDEVEKGRKKAEELGKQYISTFDTLYGKTGANNPIATVFSEGSKAITDIRKNLAGLTPELQAAAISMQEKINDNALFNAKLNNALSTFDLRDEAANFRNFKPAFNQMEADELARRNVSYGGYTPGGTYGSFLANKAGGFDKLTDKQKRDIYQTALLSQPLFNNPKPDAFTVGNNRSLISALASEQLRLQNPVADLSLQAKLQKKLDIVDKFKLGAATQEQVDAANRSIVSLTSIDPSRLDQRERAAAAIAREALADRQDKYQTEVLEIEKKKLAVQSQIAANGKKLLEIAEKEGVKGIEGLIRIVDESNGAATAELKKSPTPSDTSKAYSDYQDALYR